jgi:hypothetical protein
MGIIKSIGFQMEIRDTPMIIKTRPFRRLKFLTSKWMRASIFENSEEEE